MNTLTTNQQAVYDRQLRVWGLQVQQRLQQAKILIIGNNCLAAEVAKNCVLAGVGYVQIYPGISSFSGNPAGNYLSSTKPELGSADAFVSTLQEMNPHVSVNLAESEALDHTMLKDMDLVVLLTGTFTEQLFVNHNCHLAGVKFCCAKAVGPFGWIFLDLLQHTYIQNDNKDDSKITLKYIPLEKALSVPCSTLNRKTHGLYLILKICAEFERNSGKAANIEDMAGIMTLASEVLNTGDADHKKTLDMRMLKLYLQRGAIEFPPICSVIGGMMANEVVKIVSCNGDPIQNFFFYDIFDSKGVLHLIE